MENYLSYIDPYGPPHNNRTTKKIDPSLIQEIVRQSNKRGYSPEFSVALAGAETNFGTKGHGTYNPMSYKWRKEDGDRDVALMQTQAYKDAKQHTANLVKEGFPLKHALDMEEYKQERFVKPSLAIQKSFDTLDEKRNFLNTSKKSKAPASPARLAWLYQGNGIIGNEAPSGYAYGKPVEKTSPVSDHAKLTVQIMNELNKKDNPLGNFIRSVK
jgi:hypothetical protein